MTAETLAVVPLNSTHDRAGFTCGEPSLDRYLQQQVSQDRKRDLSRCYVLVDAQAPTSILGYYTLSAYSVQLMDLPETVAKGVQYLAIPGVLIGRLAIDQRQQGRHLGGLLLSAAVEHVPRLRAELGVRLVVVDALSDKAALFYERYGFQRFPTQSMKLYLPLANFKLPSDAQ